LIYGDADGAILVIYDHTAKRRIFALPFPQNHGINYEL
jgi:hypothetical protein